MNASTAGTKQRWAWAAGGAVAAVGLLAVLFSRSVSTPLPSPLVATRSQPTVELAERRINTALDDEATLLDPTPLFQPTRWNTAQLTVESPEPSGTFQSFRVPAKLEFADSDLKLGRGERGAVPDRPEVQSKPWKSMDLPDPVSVPGRPPDALATAMPGAIAAGFGRIDESVVTLPVQGSVVEIVAIGTGREALPPRVMEQLQALAASARPPGGRAWEALEFLAAVDVSGLAAPLTITTRSGVEGVDSYFQNFLVKTLRLGDRLPPGFYRISVGP